MATFNGTAGNDNLIGGTTNDVLNSLAGNDTLNGGAGADTMNGGVGNDVYTVDNLLDVVVEGFNAGTDTIRTSLLDPLGTFSLVPYAYLENLAYTGTLAAQLKGNSQSNLISANSATATSDTLFGGLGNDTLNGYGGNDSLMGDAGDDRLDGGAGNDRMIGGTGNDLYIVDSLSDRAYEYVSGGFDTIQSTALKDLRLSWTSYIEGLAYTGTAVAVLHGNALGNAIRSTAATNDTLNGYDGNDTLDGGAGNDSMIGGLGDDQYMVSAADIALELAGQGTDTMIGAKTSINIAAYATTIENLFYTGATGAAVIGNGLDNVVSGGAGADTVNGLVGSDTLGGGAGADSLLGGDGADWLYGGGIGTFQSPSYVADSAVDTLAGGNGDDIYRIDKLNDVIVETSTGGFDIVESAIDNSLSRYANVEAMRLATDSSDAWFGGGSARPDVIVGNYYSNYLTGGAGNDTLSGGTAYSFSYGSNSDVLDGGDGNDVLVGFGFGSSYYYLHELSLFGGLGNDLYVLGDYFSANDGNYGGLDSGGTDTAVGFGGSNSIALLEGVENLYLYGSGSPEDARARSAIDVVNLVTIGANYTGSLTNALNGIGNDLANTLLGNIFNNHLQGGAGNDTIMSGAGNDTLDGGTGTDSLDGGAGNDTYVIAGNDIIVETPGGGTLDLIQSSTLTTYAAYANIEGLIYTGSANVSLGNGAGNTSNDYFGGGSGNDTLLGYGGNDTLTGGAGNDSIDGGVGLDNLNGNAGNDTLRGGADSDVLNAEAGNDSLLGDAGFDNLVGGEGNDTLDGGDDNDTLSGGIGADSLLGGAGNDTLYANASSSFPADVSSNVLNGGDGNDTLYGADGSDTLLAGAGNDFVVGDDGNDLINAGTLTPSGNAFSTAADQLWGGDYFGSPTGDTDVFRFVAGNNAVETFAGSGQFNFNAAALVADFEAGTDRLAFAASMVGDNDMAIENASVDDVAGGTFNQTSELVIFRTDVAATFNFGQSSLSSFSAAAVISVIGSANAAFAVGAERLFAVDNGSSTAVFSFLSANADAAVTVDELSLIAVVANQAALAASDYSLF